MKYFFENIKNNFDFFLRENIVLTRKNYFENSENKSEFFENEIYKSLKNKYNLNLLNDLSVQNFLENLYFLNIFDKYLKIEKNKNYNVLDIGSKNWYYAKSEYIFLKENTEEFNLSGIELDSNRLNSNFYSRFEIAKFHTKNLENTKYISGDFLNYNKKCDLIIWILPFIVEYPLIKWGLPLKYFKPEKMLQHAFDLLNKNGEILIINQGREEYEIQKELNKKLNLNAQYCGEIEDNFSLFKNKRYISKISKF